VHGVTTWVWRRGLLGTFLSSHIPPWPKTRRWDAHGVATWYLLCAVPDFLLISSSSSSSSLESTSCSSDSSCSSHDSSSSCSSAPSIHVFKNPINQSSIMEQHISSLWAHVYVSVLPSLFMCPCIWNKFHRKNSRSWGGFGCLLSTCLQPSEFGKITAVWMWCVPTNVAIMLYMQLVHP